MKDQDDIPAPILFIMMVCVLAYVYYGFLSDKEPPKPYKYYNNSILLNPEE